MAIVFPNTSQVPLWRVPPRRQEYPVKAWRCWHTVCDRRPTATELGYNDVLFSVGVFTVWEGPVLRAHVKPFDAATWDTTRDESVWHGGIYALNSTALACDTARTYRASCVGEVHLWGRVVRFEKGWRAEYCMIRQLFVASTQKRLVDALSRRFECDVAVVQPWPLGLVKELER